MNEILKVLSNEHCGHYLNWSLSSQPEVMPEILCVADHHKWRIAIYKEKGGYEKGYQKVDQGRAYGMMPLEPFNYIIKLLFMYVRKLKWRLKKIYVKTHHEPFTKE